MQHGFTPLHLAVDNNHVQLAKLLLDKGATPDAADAVRLCLFDDKACLSPGEATILWQILALCGSAGM